MTLLLKAELKQVGETEWKGWHLVSVICRHMTIVTDLEVRQDANAGACFSYSAHYTTKLETKTNTFSTNNTNLARETENKP